MNDDLSNSLDILLNLEMFDTPKTPKSKKNQVNYSEIMGGDLSGEVRELLELGTQQRRLLVQSLTYAGTVPNPQNLIGAVNAYLPSLWRIQRSLEYSKDTKIKITAPLEFIWSSVLANEGRVSELKQLKLIFFRLVKNKNKVFLYMKLHLFL